MTPGICILSTLKLMSYLKIVHKTQLAHISMERVTVGKNTRNRIKSITRITDVITFVKYKMTVIKRDGRWA